MPTNNFCCTLHFNTPFSNPLPCLTSLVNKHGKAGERHGNQDTVCPELHMNLPLLAVPAHGLIQTKTQPKISPRPGGQRNFSCASGMWALLCSTGFPHSQPRPGADTTEALALSGAGAGEVCAGGERWGCSPVHARRCTRRVLERVSDLLLLFLRAATPVSNVLISHFGTARSETGKKPISLPVCLVT